jgi:hypothetical protein
MFIQTEATPNPATLKFLPGRAVLETGTVDLRDPADAAKSPLAERLFAIKGVNGVFYGSDFITVSKADGEWAQLKPAILGAIMEHFMSGAPLLKEGETGGQADDEFFEAADEEIVTGGDITFKGFKEGVVYLHMKGACSGCPSSTATLRHGIQNLLKHYVPEVVEVRPI